RMKDLNADILAKSHKSLEHLRQEHEETTQRNENERSEMNHFLLRVLDILTGQKAYIQENLKTLNKVFDRHLENLS
uniref:hypothetical protein n=1 Tax=Halalkalibacter lacteus TaxID=3090663 RepID=UPI002FC799CF